MLSRYFPLCLTAILVFSCKKSERGNPVPASRVDSLLVSYTGQTMLVTPTPVPMMQLPKYALHFSDGRITQRVGMFTAGSVPGSYVLDHSMYEAVSYGKDSVVVSTNYDGSGMQPAFRRKFLLENGNIRMRVRYSIADGQPYDSAWYYFKSKGKLDRIELKHGNSLKKYTYRHDARGNLKSVTIDTYLNGKQTGQDVTEYLQYDDKINPLKGILYWDDMLERGQSGNNPLQVKSYGYAETAGGGMSRYQSDLSCQYYYDNYGRADLSRPFRN